MMILKETHIYFPIGVYVLFAEHALELQTTHQSNIDVHFILVKDWIA